jgi:hypothetical protein
MAVPHRVCTAMERAEAAGFTMSCDPRVGRLLSVLAAALPRDGRILELGTGPFASHTYPVTRAWVPGAAPDEWTGRARIGHRFAKGRTPPALAFPPRA